MTDPDPVIATWTVDGCGCHIDIRRSDLPIHSMLCQHGNYVTTQGDFSTIRGSVIVGGASP